MDIIVMDNGIKTIVEIDSDDKVIDVIDKLPRRGLLKFGDNILDKGMNISDTGITSESVVDIVGDCDQCNDYVIASERGHLECLKISWDDEECNFSFVVKSACAAARGKYLDCLKFIVNSNIKEDDECNHKLIDEYEAIPEYELFTAAIDGGNLDCIKLVYDIGIMVPPDIYSAAIASDDLDIVKYVVENCRDVQSNSAISEALYHGNVEILQYLHEYGLEYNEDFIIMMAMSSGDINCVKYVIEDMGGRFEMEKAYRECDDEEIKEYLRKEIGIEI